ncbi:TadE/TadG family type IV pilus assembly protein [Tautonia marina]|uniref:TadE/TadG family type IV pilus assembly protein n=1 Tax=Tautonia marina TaxID=2653855 RepID=UPI0013761033|nr:TadE family protein [Tautonia marina]
MRVSCSRRYKRSGAAAVEMAIILPLFLALILGTIEASRLGMVSQLLHVAAREGCRTAVLPGQSEAAVQARINAALAGTGITPSVQISSPNGSWLNVEAPAPITVRLSVPFKDVSWLGDPFAFEETTVVASATMCSEKNP